MSKKDKEFKKAFNETKKIIKKYNKNRKIALKKIRFKEFIRKILTRKSYKGKKANLTILDEIHSYKESEIYNNIISLTPEEHHRINNNVLYEAEYMQNPFEILTEENLERLEKHCKKVIHYERGEIKEEHEVILCLLYKYQELQEQKEKQNKELEEKDKNNMDLYEQVKQLFKISDKAMQIFMCLKNRIQISRFSKFTDFPKEKNILCIYKNREKLNRDLNDLRGYAVIEINPTNTKIILDNGTNIIVKTIQECTKLDGYRFDEIRFK